MILNIKRIFLASSIALIANTAMAQDEGQVVEQIPPLAPAVQSGETLEPEINILETEQETIYEYRVNGELFAIKVQPKQGPAYYFFDRDGDGDMEFSRDDPLLGLNVHQWVLFRW